jgi:tetratricopeptide (TPR) repeat protein
MLGLGFGLRLRDLYLYTSYTPRVEFRNMFTVSMSYRLGETRKIKEQRLAGKLFKTAYKLYEQGKYEEAEKVLNKILEIDSNNSTAQSLKKIISSEKEIK